MDSDAPQGYVNTDRELWRERLCDPLSNSIHVTADGAIGINVGGRVIVAPLCEWHSAMAYFLDKYGPMPMTAGESPQLSLRWKMMEVRLQMLIQQAFEKLPDGYRLQLRIENGDSHLQVFRGPTDDNEVYGAVEGLSWMEALEAAKADSRRSEP